MKRVDFFRMISAGEYFIEGGEFDPFSGRIRSEKDEDIVDFNTCQHDWECRIMIRESDLSRYYYHIVPISEEAKLYCRDKKISMLRDLYGNRCLALRAYRNEFSFDAEVVQSVKELAELAKVKSAPKDFAPWTLEAWAEGVSPTYDALSVPRKHTVINILYGTESHFYPQYEGDLNNTISLKDYCESKGVEL